MIQLDTSSLIRALNLGSPEDRKLRAWIGAGETHEHGRLGGVPVLSDDLGCQRQLRSSDSTVTSPRITRRLPPVYSTGRRRGSLIDCMVAAVALADGAPIATENVADFRRFEDFGLKVV